MPLDYQSPFDKPDAYTPYAAGAKTYGLGQRTNPTMGVVDKGGYMERDAMAAARKEAIMRKMKAQQQGNYMSSAALNPGV